MPSKIGRTYGWRPDLPRLGVGHYSAPRAAQLPQSTNNRVLCPPVYDQGQLGSCTANALAGAFDYERCKQGLPFVTPSRLFVYYNERAAEGTVASDAGAAISDGIASINAQGVCPEGEWPYDVSQFATRPPDACYADALRDRAISCLRVAQTEADVKSSLAIDQKCVVFGFTVYESFESDAVASTGIVPMPGPDEQVLGGHAVVAVDYDDSQQAFCVRNSWGADWGLGGYCWFPYAYLLNSQLASDLWQISLVETT